MKALETVVERLILGNRWIPVFLLGLAVTPAVDGLSFGVKLWKVIGSVFVYDEAEKILAMLGLIDTALIASLLVRVMIASQEIFVVLALMLGVLDKIMSKL
jgi:uncharacterized protein (TIGR00645 family)